MIVVIQTAFLGDLILSVPAIESIKKAYPTERILIVCKKGLGSFLTQLGICDEAIEVEKGHRLSYQEAIQKVGRFDVRMVVCLHRSVRSLLFGWRIKAQEKISFKSWLAKILGFKTSFYPKQWPDVLRYLQLVSLINPELQSRLKNQIPKENWTQLNEFDDDRGFIPLPDFSKFPRKKIASSNDQVEIQNTVALFPGSVWATKRWTEQGFADVGVSLVASGVDVVLMGSPDERVLCDRISDLIFSKTQTRVKNKCGELPIAESILFLKNVRLVVCNDSAAQHMAAFVGTPSVAIFGPTTLDLGFRPWNDQSRVAQIPLECRPCGAHGHVKCPLGHHHCMQKLTSTQVLDQIRKTRLLNNFL